MISGSESNKQHLHLQSPIQMIVQNFRYPAGYPASQIRPDAEYKKGRIIW
jgi:hypothetical protein